MTGGQSIEQGRFSSETAAVGNLVDFSMELAETLAVLVDRTHSEDVQAIFRQGTGLVEGKDVDLASDIDSIRRDTENSQLSKSIDSKGRADRECGRQGGRYNNRDQVECTDQDGIPGDLLQNDGQRCLKFWSIEQCNTHSHADKLHRTDSETKSSDHGKNTNETHRVTVELESHRLHIEGQQSASANQEEGSVLTLGNSIDRTRAPLVVLKPTEERPS